VQIAFNYSAALIFFTIRIATIKYHATRGKHRKGD